jgi:serine O-acetyltransferase
MNTEAAIRAEPSPSLFRALWERFHLVHDIRAALRNDPAARHPLGVLEVLFTYAGFHAITIHRFTHLLHRLRIPFLPRALSQINRFITGIEIHPGAQIGRFFFIDHGMGVVIGATTIIGDHVNLFHQVTLGGTGKETGKRHPTLGNHVTVGAGAKILGNIVIGDHVLIGSNSVVLRNVPDHATVVGIPGRVVKRRDEKAAPEDDLRHDLVPDPVMKHIRTLQSHIENLEKRVCGLDKEFTEVIEQMPQFDQVSTVDDQDESGPQRPDIYQI